MIQLSTLFFFFLQEIENMFSMFLSSSRNTHEILGELKKAVAINMSLFSQSLTCVSTTVVLHNFFLFLKCYFISVIVLTIHYLEWQ